MNRKTLRRILLGAAAIIAVAWLCVWALLREPHYNGQPLSYWLAQEQPGSAQHWRLGYMPRPLTDDAQTAVKEIGMDGIPTLARLANTTEESRLKRLVRPLVFWKTNRTITSSQGQAYAISGFKLLGVDGTSALIGLLENGENPRCALAAVWGVERDSRIIPSLHKCLSHEDPIVRAYSAKLLAGHRGEASVAIPELLRNLSDQDRDVRSSAKSALKKIAPDQIPTTEKSP